MGEPWPRTLFAGAAVLIFFVVWTVLTSRPVVVTYNSKYSIFARNYRQYGLLGTHFISYYNFELTDPPFLPGEGDGLL